MGVGARVPPVIAFTALMLVGSGLAVAEEQMAPVRVPFIEAGRLSSPTTVTVARGDHLWKIARTHLEVSAGEEPSTGQIARYWRRVIELNSSSLRSGDPNLIYPGEVITLPDGPVSELP